MKALLDCPQRLEDRRTGDATFLKGPVSQIRLAQLVAELENSLVA